MAACTGLGFVRSVEAETYHKEEKRSRERRGKGVTEQLTEGFTLEDAVLKLDVKQSGRQGDDRPVGKFKAVGVRCVFAKSGDGWKGAPDGRPQVSR